MFTQLSCCSLRPGLPDSTAALAPPGPYVARDCSAPPGGRHRASTPCPASPGRATAPLTGSCLLQCCPSERPRAHSDERSPQVTLWSLPHRLLCCGWEPCHWLAPAGSFIILLPLMGQKFQDILALRMFAVRPYNNSWCTNTVKGALVPERMENTLGTCVSKHGPSEFFQKVFPVRSKAKTDTVHMLLPDSPLESSSGTGPEPRPPGPVPVAHGRRSSSCCSETLTTVFGNSWACAKARLQVEWEWNRHNQNVFGFLKSPVTTCSLSIRKQNQIYSTRY